MATGLIFDIKRFAVHDGPGIRTTVFFKGCAATCWWCHNPESQTMRLEKTIKQNRFDQHVFQEEELVGREVTIEQVMTEVCKDQVYYEQSNGGVTISGGEPLLQPEFLRDLLKRCRQENIHTALDTTGYAPAEVFAGILDETDLFLYDIKFVDDRLHQKYAGVSNVIIIDNLKTLIKSGKNLRLRFPLIPGITDTNKNVDQIISFLNSLNQSMLNIDLLPYHKIARHKYEKLNKYYPLGDIDAPSPESIAKIRTKLQDAQFTVDIGG